MDQTAYPLLAKDPQPSLMLAADAKPLALNAALQAWIDEGPALTSWLPANCAALVRACLRMRPDRIVVGERQHVAGHLLAALVAFAQHGHHVVGSGRLQRQGDGVAAAATVDHRDVPS